MHFQTSRLNCAIEGSRSLGLNPLSLMVNPRLILLLFSWMQLAFRFKWSQSIIFLVSSKMLN